MKYVPNGSGLFLPDSPFNGRLFSVPDGTGYTPTNRCKQTGFGTGSDKLIFPDRNPANWTTTAAGFWATPPYHIHQNHANAYVGTYMTAMGTQAFGDQWCGANIVSLFGANNLGISIGPMVRFTTSSIAGYYVNGIIDTGGNFLFETGTFIGGSSTANIVTRVAWNPATQPFILVKATGTGANIIVTGYAGTMQDFLNNTLTVMTAFNVGTFRNDTGIPGAVGSSGTNGVDFVDAVESNWIAGIIGAC